MQYGRATAWHAEMQDHGTDSRMNALTLPAVNEARGVAGERDTPAGDNNVDDCTGAFGMPTHPDHTAHAGAAPLIVYRDGNTVMADNGHTTYGAQSSGGPPRDMREDGPYNTGISS